MKVFFVILSTAFAAVPGLSVLLTAIGVPNADDKLLFMAVIEVFGCATLGLILLNKTRFSSMPLPRLNKLIIGSFVVFFIALVLYIILYKLCVFEHDGNSKVFFPLYYTDALHNAVNVRGGELSFIEYWLGDGANIQIAKMAETASLFSTIIFLLVYQLVFTALVAGFGLLAAKQ